MSSIFMFDNDDVRVNAQHQANHSNNILHNQVQNRSSKTATISRRRPLGYGQVLLNQKRFGRLQDLKNGLDSKPIPTQYTYGANFDTNFKPELSNFDVRDSSRDFSNDKHDRPLSRDMNLMRRGITRHLPYRLLYRMRPSLTKRRETVQLPPSNLIRLFGESSVPGVRDIALSQSFLRRIFWICSFLFFGFLALRDISQLASEYYTYPITVDVRLRDSRRLQFPAVTVCNLNIVRYSALCYANVSIIKESMIPRDLREKLCGVQPQAATAAAAANAAQQQSQQQQQLQTQTVSSAQSTATNSETLSQSGSSSKGTINSTLSITSTVNSSTNTSASTTISSALHLSSNKTNASTTTTTDLVNTASMSQQNNNTNSNNQNTLSLQPKNSIDSQKSLDTNVNNYQVQARSSDNKIETNTYGSTTYNQATNQQQKQTSDLDKTKGGFSGVDNSSLYSSIKPTQHHPSNKASSLYYHQPKTAGGGGQVPGTRSSIMSLQDTLYHPPFSPSMNANANCLYGYTGQHPAAAAVTGATPTAYHHPGVPQHHHHSIPSLYQPSVIYQQTPTQAQSFYDASAANSALAILDNSAAQHYGTAQTYAGQLATATAEPTYGQYYYQAPAAQPLGREVSANTLNYHPSYYQSQSLYDYIPFPRAITPGTINPIPTAVAASLGQKQHSTQHTKSRSSLTGVIDQRLYSSSLEVPMTPKESIYYESKLNNKTGCGQAKAGSSGQHHHHYYYHQVYGTSGSKYGQQHYGTVRHSPMTSALNHNHHLLAPNSAPLVAASGATTDASGASASTQSNQTRHFQHYFPDAGHSSSGSSANTNNNRQHHSSHPQLLAGTCLTLPGAHHSAGLANTTNAESNVATNSGTMSYRRGHQHHNHHHQSSSSSSHANNSIYGPVGLGTGSVGHYGYSLEHAANAAHSSASIFGHNRNDAFANPGFAPLGSSNLHHSNSFHGHLDDFDLVGLGSAGGTGAASDFETTSETQPTTSSKSGHSKGHGHSGWV